jgi:hypothetical protein
LVSSVASLDILISLLQDNFSSDVAMGFYCRTIVHGNARLWLGCYYLWSANNPLFCLKVWCVISYPCYSYNIISFGSEIFHCILNLECRTSAFDCFIRAKVAKSDGNNKIICSAQLCLTVLMELWWVVLLCLTIIN